MYPLNASSDALSPGGYGDPNGNGNKGVGHTDAGSITVTTTVTASGVAGMGISGTTGAYTTINTANGETVQTGFVYGGGLLAGPPGAGVTPAVSVSDGIPTPGTTLQISANVDTPAVGVSLGYNIAGANKGPDLSASPPSPSMTVNLSLCVTRTVPNNSDLGNRSNSGGQHGFGGGVQGGADSNRTGGDSRNSY